MRRIAICITAYNMENFIHIAVSSALLQQAPDCQLKIFVVDDNSSDQTWFRLKELFKHHPRVSLFSRIQNSGASASRNFLAYMAEMPKPDFILHFDGDDEMGPGMVASLLQTLDENPQASYAYPGWWFIGGRRNDFLKGEKPKVEGTPPGIFTVRSRTSEWYHVQDYNPIDLRESNYLQTTCLIRNNEATRKVVWDRDLAYLNDWAFHADMAAAGLEGVRSPQAYFQYLHHSRPESLSLRFRKNDQLGKLRDSAYPILRRHGLSTPYRPVFVNFDATHNLRSTHHFNYCGYFGVHVTTEEMWEKEFEHLRKYDFFVFYNPSERFLSSERVKTLVGEQKKFAFDFTSSILRYVDFLPQFSFHSLLTSELKLDIPNFKVVHDADSDEEALHSRRYIRTSGLQMRSLMEQAWEV